jgi:hypothetical protein
VHAFPVPEKRRRFERVVSKKPASLVINLGRYQDFGQHEERLPCLVLDSSQGGFRIRAIFPLRRGQVVELILNAEFSGSSVQCIVVWVGKTGQAGLQPCSLS